MPGLYRCIRLITRAWKNQLYRLPPKKDYHAYITRGIYHYAYAQQTQVNGKKKTNKEKGKEMGAWGKEKEATAAAPYVVCLPMLSVGVHARRTYCCSHPVRTGFLVRRRHDDELNTEGR